MEQQSSTDSLSLQERIRSLGFNPEYLTPEEQMELLALHASLPATPAEPGWRDDELRRGRIEDPDYPEGPPPVQREGR